MAILHDGSGRYLRLEPLRYQFEDLDRERAIVEQKNAEIQQSGGRHRVSLTDTDANWVVVRIAVWDGERRWATTDPAFLVQELEKLVGWLRARAGGLPDPLHGYGIIEQCLDLAAEGMEGELRLRATFRRQFHPDGRRARHGPYIVEFAPTEAELRTFAAELQEELRSFPARRVP